MFFCLRPFAFYGVEVWGIWGEKFEGMPRIADNFLDVGAFVEGGVVHDDDGFCGKLGEQILPDPSIKDGSVDVGIEQANRQEQLSDQGTDGVGSAPFLPVLRAKATLSSERIAVSTGHVVREPALVNIDDGAGFGLIGGDLLLEDMPCGDAGLGVHQGFFYM